jgi:hypothetical protein
MMCENLNELYVAKELYRQYVNNCIADGEPHLAFRDWLIRRERYLEVADSAN